MRFTGRMILAVVAVLAVLLAPAATTPAHADHGILEERAKYCVGVKVRRCLWVNVDTVNYRIRGYATIRDVDDSANYDVAVNEIRIQRRNAAGDLYQTAWQPDHDGWHDFYDQGASELDYCYPYGGEEYRVRAHFQWREHGAREYTDETLSSYWVHNSLCFT